jgi:hypothetical protein
MSEDGKVTGMRFTIHRTVAVPLDSTEGADRVTLVLDRHALKNRPDPLAIITDDLTGEIMEISLQHHLSKIEEDDGLSFTPNVYGVVEDLEGRSSTVESTSIMKRTTTSSSTSGKMSTPVRFA